MIHRTLTDDLGNNYKIVASWWLKLITALSIIEFVILVLIIAGLIDNVRRVENTLNFSEMTQERYRALVEIGGDRALAQKFAFDHACQEAKRQGQECPDIQWYADPANYPLLLNDPAGAGLFAPTPNATTP